MDQQITALIVDDDLRSREVLSLHLRSIAGITVIGAARDAGEALHILMDKVPDILFLDVEMPGKTGFDLVADLKRLNIQTCVVFQTAFNHYAIQAIKTAAFDYLMKPIDPDELSEVVAKYRAAKPHTHLAGKIDELMAHLKAHKKIRFNTRTGFIMIDPAEIVYCQADWSYTEIYLRNGTRHTVSMNIGKVEELLNPKIFFRLNRSVLVRIDVVVSINRKTHQCMIKCASKEISFKIPAEKLRELTGKLGE
ncbi:MAG TPA: response regulator transcription factor [Bacteroidales bacterium]|nr:response regulator transcription factor [Bacteroidales bacterium]HPS50810.1 response regulator transcription factor [Bacteroidales bacterium]